MFTSLKGDPRCCIHACLDASLVFDPSVIPANAVHHTGPICTWRWTTRNGPCEEIQFSIHCINNRVWKVFVYAHALYDVAADLCAHARSVLHLPDAVPFEKQWKAVVPQHHAALYDTTIMCFHGDALVKIYMYRCGGCVMYAHTFADMECVAAAIIHKEPFVHIARVFGFDRNALLRLSRCAAKDVTFQWYTYILFPVSDGWPPVHDGVLKI